jgi:PAS domain S-box-containing protein
MVTHTASVEHTHWLVAKRSLLPLLLSVVVIAAAGYAHFTLSVRVSEAARAATEREQIEFGRIAIEAALDGAVSNLLYLAESGSLGAQFEVADRRGRQALENSFRLFVEKHAFYDQVRYLDLRGKEIVRVNLDAGRPVVVPDASLQDKSNRYYFQDAVVLERGDVYVSPMDLNVERGVVEMPIKPVIRLATSVYDLDGNKTGILVFNYLGEKLLQGFRAVTSSISERVMLLNADGYWMSSPNNEDEWGFVFAVERTFATDYPVTWEQIQAAESGRFESTEGSFTFTTVRLDRASDIGTDAARSLSWKIVLRDEIPALGDRLGSFFERNRVLYLAMLLLVAVGAFVTARIWVRRRMLEGELDFERRFREILKNVDLLAVGLDGDGRITFCNHALMRFLGRGEEELIGRDWFHACVPADRQALGREAFQESMSRRDTNRRYQGAVEHADGGPRTVTWNDTLLYDPERGLIGVVRIGEETGAV